MKKTIIAMAIALTAAAGAQAEHLYSLNKDYIDQTTPAGTDFYKHVNKGWMDAHPLTPEYSRYGVFNVLGDTSEMRVKNLVIGLKDTNPAQGTTAFNVMTIYEQAMDSTRRNAEGAAPIQADLKRIMTTPLDAKSMEDLFLWIHGNFSSPLFAAGPMEDMMDSNNYAMYVGSGSLGLGDRDYYLLNDARNTEVRNAYKKLITRQMENAGLSKKEAKRVMESVMAIETAMAEKAWTREQSRDVQAQYNPTKFADLKAQYPNLPWDRFFVETMGIESPEVVIIDQKEPLARANELYAKAKPAQLRDYYLWKYVAQAAPYLSDKFSDTSFEFAKVMSGVTEQRPRWKRALGATEGAMGEAIGELYVKEYFPESSKEYMLNLVENLRVALGKHIINLPWMTDDTKYQALKKLNAFKVKIGYPDKFETYEGLVIDPSLSYYQNMHNVSMWHQKETLSRWGKPVDKTRWEMTPQTVNAYYNPVANEIVFPAGILQAPFFDPNASDAENYGGIGVVIGHEMTHGFDDQGRHFDGDGNMNGWWTEEDAAAFENLAKGLGAQFDAVEVLPGLYANGTYTMGENIADQGGLRVAMTAFLDSQKKKGVDVNSEEAKIDGFTPAQVFYMNYANLWAQNMRDAEKRNRVVSDVHSLGEHRVNVSLRNLAPFFEAFSITEGEPMWRPEAERVIIW